MKKQPSPRTKTSSSVGDVLDLARALRREGFVVTQLAVGDASVTLEPVIAPMPSKRTARADAGGVVSEYGGQAIEKLLGEHDDGDADDYVPAVKA